jgi:hypothetical protein
LSDKNKFEQILRLKQLNDCLQIYHVPHIKCVSDWKDPQLNKLFIEVPARRIKNKVAAQQMCE